MRTQKPTPGGWVNFVSVDLMVAELGKNKLSEGGCEDLWLKILKRGTEKYFVRIIYRHPKSDVNKFLTALNNKLVQVSKSNFIFYVVGDININVTLNEQFKSNSTNSLNMLRNNFAFAVINKATRVTDTSKSTIEYIVTNDISNLIYLCDLTDHYPVGCLVKSLTANRKKNNCISYRDIKNFDADDFQNDVENSLDYVLKKKLELNNSNLESIFSDVVKAFNDCVDMHAPLKIALRRRCKLIKKPWITKHIFESIYRKRSL